MYSQLVPQIAALAGSGPEGLFRVGVFVQATINRHFEVVPMICESMLREGSASRFCNPNQRKALDALWERRVALYSGVYHEEHDDDNTLLALWVNVPGFGVIKGAFVLQLIWASWGLGCLDRHHLRLAGLDERKFSSTPTSLKARALRIAAYVAVCQKLGGAQVLWDKWCEHIAALRPGSFDNAEHVSRLHVDCTVGLAHVPLPYK